MRAADIPGVLAACFVALAGFSSMLYLRNVSAPVLARETSYLGGLSVASTAGQEPARREDNPYNLEAHRDRIAAGESFLDASALLAIAMLGGAAGARVGTPIRAWRGAVGVALGAIGLVLWGAPQVEVSMAVLLFALAAGAVGGLGGLLVKRLVARRFPGNMLAVPHCVFAIIAETKGSP